jgi:hypothetical protein
MKFCLIELLVGSLSSGLNTGRIKGDKKTSYCEKEE